MAWYVEHLLKNKVYIEANEDLESSIFSDLMVVEKAIDSLTDEGSISGGDLSILKLLMDNASRQEASTALSMSRPTFAKRLILATDKIAERAGYEYTDRGFIARVQETYKLDAEQAQTLKEYMTSKFKHKIMRKRYNAKKTI